MAKHRSAILFLKDQPRYDPGKFVIVLVI